MIPINSRHRAPTIEWSVIAKLGPILSATSPINNAPNGCEPIAKLTTPKALPRISGRETNITEVDCIVLNPEWPIPNTKSKINDSKYHEENEKIKSVIMVTIDPIRNSLPW